MFLYLDIAQVTAQPKDSARLCTLISADAYQEMGGFLRWSLTLYPEGSSKSCGSGSEAVNSTMVNVCFPTAGSERMERRLNPSCCECHSSFTTWGVTSVIVDLPG